MNETEDFSPEETDALRRFDELTQAGDDRETALPVVMCRAAVQVLPVDGAGIIVRLGSDVSVPIGASDPDSTAVEQLEYTLGHGPCIVAAIIGRPVLVPDLEASDAREHWPDYVAETIRSSPFRAVFSFPLAREGLAIGSLNLYRRAAASTAPETVTGPAQQISARITDLLQAADLFGESEDEHPWMDGDPARDRRVVWTAQGMTMRAGHVSARAALSLMRARAYAGDRVLDDLAGDIVEGRAAPPRIDD